MLHRKVKRVLSERVDTPDLVATLKHLSTFYGDNTLENRRNLRSVLEKQGQSLNQQFIDSFQSIVDEFDKVAKSVDKLSTECQHIERILNETKESTNTLLSTTTKLRNEKNGIQNKEKIVNSFLNRFQLNPQEKKILNQFMYENIITFDLFDVFERMVLIRNDCKKLLNNYHQRASLDIMDRLAKQLESGYEKLYRWVQKNARQLGVEYTPDIDLALFAHSLYELRPRAGYFEHCCQELASARRLYWVQRFIHALTKGETSINASNGSSPNSKYNENTINRPIEMYAYDPVRYCNDMLTWIHSAINEERDFAVNIYSIPARLVKKQMLDMEESSVNYEEYPLKRKMRYLDRVCEGLYRPLSVRILSILNNANKKSNSVTDFAHAYDVVTAYRLCHVLDFYVITIRQLFEFAINSDHDFEEKQKQESIQLKFIESLQDLRKMSYNKFYNMVRHRMDKFLDTSSSTSGANPNKASILSTSSAAMSGITIASDLAPHNVFKDHLDRLNDVQSIYSTNLVPNNLKIEDFTAVLNCFIDPMLQVVNKSIASLTDTEECVYLMNILVIILETLKKQPFAKHSARFETLSLLIETQKEKLIKSESSFILKDCGVHTVICMLKEHKKNQRPNDKQALCQVQGLDESSMKLAIKSLSAYIFSLGALSMPKMEKITDLEIRSTARNGVAQVIFSAYKLLFDALSDANNGYQDVDQQLTHSLKNVKQILQLT